MKSPLSDDQKSVRVTSESIQRELSQLIGNLEGYIRRVDDTRFRKISMKSAEVLRGLRTLFERLGSEDQAKRSERPESVASAAKAGGRSSATAGKQSTNEAGKKSAPSAKQNGSVSSVAGKKRGTAATPSGAKRRARTRKTGTPLSSPERGAPANADPIVATAKPEDPDEIAAKARLQRQEARAPKRPGGHAAPRPLPPQSGKPIWSKPHSS